MTEQTRSPSLLNRIARVLLCLVFVNAVNGKLTGFGAVAGVIAAKGLPLVQVSLTGLEAGDHGNDPIEQRIHGVEG